MTTRIIEVEAKYSLDVPIDKFVQKLLNLGFTHQSDLHEIDTYYTRPDVDYMQTVECLRIRKRDDTCEMTYKPATVKLGKNGVTAKRETNIQISQNDYDEAKIFLQNIGMKELVVVDKHRTSYASTEYPHVSIVVDSILHTGVFVEIEAMTNDVEAANRTIDDLRSKLGFSVDQVVRDPYRDIVMKAE